MKIIYFGRKKEKRESTDVIERMLFTVFIGLLTITVFSQISYFRPNALKLPVAEDAFVGAPLGAEEYLYISGTVELRLMNADSNPDLIVLVNGDKAAQFDSKDVKLEVSEGDIIEIDGSNVNEAEVAVCAVSDKLQKDILGQVFTLKNNVQKVMTVKSATK